MELHVAPAPSPEGGFTVIVPALPGCISEGDTEEEAMANIREAIGLRLEDTDTERLKSEGAAIVREIAV
jgi:predicted RNase H-like HicB family nuclease